MQNHQTLQLFIRPEQQGQYLTLPFNMPANVETLSLRYRYQRYQESQTIFNSATFTSQQEMNIIDLGLIDPDGIQVGASGSDKNEITLNEVFATPGYHPCRLAAGKWQILVGAYKVAPNGVNVVYELEFTFKQRRLLKGDLHTHTLASDGVLTAAELGWRAKRHGLDFLAITDHNQLISRAELPVIPGLTLIPGVEWTHYRGHASFLGSDKPYDTPFAANTPEEIRARFESAHQRGALVVIDHPCDETCSFQVDWQSLPFDCLEIWNGPMRMSNLQAVGLWHNLLVAGQKIPVCGGSDYHRDTPFIFLGGPTTCVFCMSAAPQDILQALKEGHSYITFAPNGPWLEMTAGNAILGDTVNWPTVNELNIEAGGLIQGDVVRVVTASGSHEIVQAPSAGRIQAKFRMQAPGFARLEISRAFLPGIPMLPALISNPIYFNGEIG